MNLSDYQRRSRATAIYPDAGDNLLYPTLGLCGEAGEVAEKVKKMIRDDGGILKHERRMAMAKELGDVLWYLTACAHGIGFNLGDILHMNVAKLEDRKERNGTLKGDGDDR